MATAYFVLMIYNEEGAIPSVIKSICAREIPGGYERRIVAINDGSTDGSQMVLETAARSHPVDIVRFERRTGMPGSFKGLFRYLSDKLQDDDIVFTLEADGTNDVACLPLLFEGIKGGADVVVASRYTRGGASIGFPLYRALGSRVVSRLLRLFWRIPHIRDYTILSRAYRGAALRSYIADDVPFVSAKSFAVIAEILLHLTRYTNNFAEVPLRYDYGLKRGASKMRLLGTLWEYVRITALT